MSKMQQSLVARHALYLWRRGQRSEAREQIWNARLRVHLSMERKGMRAV